jgi:hypothetical protein
MAAGRPSYDRAPISGVESAPDARFSVSGVVGMLIEGSTTGGVAFPKSSLSRKLQMWLGTGFDFRPGLAQFAGRRGRLTDTLRAICRKGARNLFTQATGPACP